MEWGEAAGAPAEYPEVWTPTLLWREQRPVCPGFPAWEVSLPLLPPPDVLASPGVLGSPEEPGAAASGESPQRWHSGRAARWRELQQSCSVCFPCVGS